MTYKLWLILIVFILTGCLTTLYPIFHVTDVTFNPVLLGYWKYIDDKKEKFIEFRKIPDDRKLELTASIKKISDKGYLVSSTDSLGVVLSQSFVFLAKIGKNYYLDFYPAEMPSQKGINKFYKSHESPIINNHIWYTFRNNLMVAFHNFLIRRKAYCHNFTIDPNNIVQGLRH